MAKLLNIAYQPNTKSIKQEETTWAMEDELACTQLKALPNYRPRNPVLFYFAVFRV